MQHKGYPKTLVKDGRAVVVGSPAERVKYEFEGYRIADTTESDAAAAEKAQADADAARAAEEAEAQAKAAAEAASETEDQHDQH